MGYRVNATTNTNKITKLTVSDDPNYPGVLVGGISGGVGNTVQIQSVVTRCILSMFTSRFIMKAASRFEGLYVDRNGDGEITDADRYRYKSPNPDATFRHLYDRIL